METAIPSLIFCHLLFALMAFIHAHHSDRAWGGMHSALSVKHYTEPPKWVRWLLGVRHRTVLKFTYAQVLAGIVFLCLAAVSPAAIALVYTNWGEYAGAVTAMLCFVVPFAVYTVGRLSAMLVYHFLYKRKK